MSTISELNINGSLSGALQTSFYDVTQYNHIRALLFCNNDATVVYNWSGDKGVNTDYQDTYNITGGTSQVPNVPIRAKYLSISYSAVAYPSTFRCFNDFFFDSQGLAILDNTGSGAEIYKKSVQKVRSVTSSDSSITVQQLADEIDLLANGSNVSLASAGGTSLVSDGIGPDLGIKGLTAGSHISLTSNVNDISISLSQLSYGLIKFANGAGATQTATTTPTPVTVYSYFEPELLVDFTHAVNGTLVYIGATSKKFIVYGNAAVRPTSTSNMFFVGILYQGTTMIDNIPCTVLSTTDQKVPTFYTIITLTTNDSLAIGMFTLSGTQSVSFTKALLSVVEMRS